MNVERVSRMEVCLDGCTAAVKELSVNLEQLDSLREDMGELFRYYGSEDWYEDRDSRLPEGVKAGVLSEDAVYDLITDVRDASFRMLELATDILKNRI